MIHLLLLFLAFNFTNGACCQAFSGNVGSGSYSSSQKKLSFVPFLELNQGQADINSHARLCGRSSIEKMFSSYIELDSTAGVINPYYARIRRLADGKYMLLWQMGVTPSDGNGKSTYYAVSYDLSHWKYMGCLWECQNVTNSRNEEDLKCFTNADVIQLRNGDIMAVDNFRCLKSYQYIDCKKDQGIVIKFSSDGGITWKDEKVIYHGPCWECFLMELPSGQIQCYFSESRPWISHSHSGTSMIFSNDGGKTWSPTPDETPYRIIRKRWYNQDDNVYYFTNQMPIGILLNGTNQFAFSLEDVASRVNGRQSYYVSIAFSPTDGHWNILQGDEVGPKERLENIVGGTGPYLIQMKSGEAILGYTSVSDWRLHLMIGDERAHSFHDDKIGWSAQGGWPGMEVETDHTFLAVMKRNGGNGKPAGISLARFALNHDISATRRTISVDASDGDWDRTDEALYLGAESPTEATIRSSADAKNVYFLVEIKDKSLSTKDMFSIFLAPNSDGKSLSSAIRLDINARGILPCGIRKNISGLWKKIPSRVDVSVAYDGTIDRWSDDDYGYLLEICIPRNELDIREGEIKFNAALHEANVENDDVLCPIEDSSNWKLVKNL